MASKKSAVPVLAGVAGGAIIGALAGSMLGGNYDAVRPRIDASVYTVPVNTPYTLTFVNFPPNAQLVGPVSLAPPQIVTIGTTDATGKVVVQTTSAATAGTYYLIAWDARTGKYCAVLSIVVV